MRKEWRGFFADFYMNILALGDVVGVQGCEFLRKKLPALKKLKGIDFCLANGENSASGNGITPESAKFLLDSGVDFITTGNHVYRRREIYDYLDESRFVIRPANYCAENPGKGTATVDLGRVRIGIINVLGNAFISNGVENAFSCVEKALDEIRDCKIKLVDFHAEATGEKRAMGFLLNGKVTAVFGTHTHVQTADEQVLSEGTGYISDLGMTGPKDTVLGVDSSIVINAFRTAMPARFNVPDLPCIMCGCIFEVDDRTGKTVSVERICIA